jgi:hypothetical protein
MRSKSSADKMSVRAIAGSHVVILAWDIKKELIDGLLGFAIERTEFDKGKIKEREWLRAMKRFAGKDTTAKDGSQFRTNAHPVQAFQWGDYAVSQKTDYEYRVVPVYGVPLALELREDAAVTIKVKTEPEEGDRHSVYFNRGAAASQAYSRRWGSEKPDADDPFSDKMTWLSRGLYEGLTAFIKEAENSQFALRAALYEFHYEGVASAFRAAVDREADVEIVYDADQYKAPNETTISKASLKDHCFPRTAGGIKHNKFIVLLKSDKPVAVWTGSTNISLDGIFGQSNVGHVIRDEDVAAQYLEFWSRLKNGDSGKDHALRNEAATPTPGLPLAKGALAPMFSPRSRRTLDWYADRLASAQSIGCITLPFNFDDRFVKKLQSPSDGFFYVLREKSGSENVTVVQNGNVLVASGAKLDAGDFAHFLDENLIDPNGIKYIHTKYMLVDPLGDEPLVITGSANFSGPSQDTNDENMMVINGDKRVADIYFGEFMRLFDHLYARYIAQKIKKEGSDTKGAGFLKEKSGDWAPAHFGEGPKSRRREIFHGPWDGIG